MFQCFSVSSCRDDISDCERIFHLFKCSDNAVYLDDKTVYSPEAKAFVYWCDTS